MIPRLINNLPIRYKILLPMITALAIMVIAIYIYFPHKQKEELYRAYYMNAQTTSQLFSAAISSAIELRNFSFLHTTMQKTQTDSNIILISLFDHQEELIGNFVQNKKFINSNLFNSLDQIENHPMVLNIKQEIFNSEGMKLGKLIVFYNLESLHNYISEYKKNSLIFALVSFVIGSIFIMLVSNSITSPHIGFRSRNAKSYKLSKL